MKKLHIINLEKMGGVERLFLQYLNESVGDDNVILCISNRVGEEIQRQMPHHEVIFANRLSNSSTVRCPQFLRKYHLQWKINRINADVIIVWDLVPGLVRKPKRGKLLYYDHGCSWRYALNAKTLRFFSMLDGVVSISHASKRVMELRFNLTCPIDVVINRIKPPAGVLSAPKVLAQPLRLGTASRLVSLKGISVMLLTLQELLNRGHDVVLEIAGKGPDLDSFVALAKRLNIESKVTFSGFQHHVADFFNRTDIYLSTPVTEPFGLSTMEALYFGIPVVFPMIDGQPEAVIDGGCGIGVIPTVSVTEHEKLSGVHVDFPHEVYDPIADTLTTPKLMSHVDCANAVEKLMQPGTYAEMSRNAKDYSANTLNYAMFLAEFNQTIERYARQP